MTAKPFFLFVDGGTAVDLGMTLSSAIYYVTACDTMFLPAYFSEYSVRFVTRWKNYKSFPVICRQTGI